MQVSKAIKCHFNELPRAETRDDIKVLVRMKEWTLSDLNSVSKLACKIQIENGKERSLCNVFYMMMLFII